jgi:HEPN domain-containing protein
MFDVDKQISYWKEVAADDWRVANKLLAGKETLSALFFAHLTIEKVLKAHVCRQTQDYAPMIHNLLSLAQRASITLSSEQAKLLAELTTYNIRGRYPDMRGGHIEKPTLQYARLLLKQTKEMYEWLKSQL